MTPRVEILVDDAKWRKLGKSFLARVEEASKLALKQKNLSSPASALSREGRGPRYESISGALRPGSPSPRSQPLARPGMTILLTNDITLRELNASFRGKDKPTNV